MINNKKSITIVRKIDMPDGRILNWNDFTCEQQKALLTKIAHKWLSGFDLIPVTQKDKEKLEHAQKILNKVDM